MRRAEGRSHENLRLRAAGDGPRSRRGRFGTGRRLSGGRHQPSRPDEGRRDAARAGSSTSAIFPASTASRTLPMAACGSARSCATPTSLTIGLSPGAFRRSPRRCCRARPRSFAMPRRSAAISCSGRAAPTSTTSPAPAISASPARAATPAAARTGCTPCSGGARAASRPTRPISACRWSRSTPSSRSKAEPGGGRSRSKSFHRLPGDAPERESMLEPGEMIVAVRLPAEAARFAAHARYLKVRERTSYAFAVVSAAAALRIEDGTIARGAPRARRRRHETLARPRGRS